MTKPDTIQFIDFARQLYTVADRVDDKKNSGLYLQAMLTRLLKKEELNQNQASYLNWLEKEYEFLKLGKLTLKQLHTLPVSFSSNSNSCGWGIQADADEVYVRFTQRTTQTAEDFTMPRPDMIAGVEILRSDITSKTASETHPLINGLENIKAFKDNHDLQKGFVNVCAAVISQCGYKNISDKADDYGAIVFDHTGKDIRQLNYAESSQIIYDNKSFKTPEGKPVIVVPYLFDTETLKENRLISRDEQRDRLEKFWINEEALDKMELKGFGLEYKSSMIECYMDHDMRVRQKRLAL
jgi:hypothetical protein